MRRRNVRAPTAVCPEIADIAPKRQYFCEFVSGCLASFATRRSSVKTQYQPRPRSRGWRAGDVTECGEDFLQGAHPARQENGLQQPQGRTANHCSSSLDSCAKQSTEGQASGLKPQFRSHEQPDTSPSKNQPFVRFLCLGAPVRCLLLSRQAGPWPGIAEAQPGRALTKRPVPLGRVSYCVVIRRDLN